MSEYSLNQYFDAEKPDFSLPEEQIEEIRDAMKNLKDLCEKYNVPMVGAVCISASGNQFDLRLSTWLDIHRTPVEMLVMRHLAAEGLLTGSMLAFDLLSQCEEVTE